MATIFPTDLLATRAPIPAGAPSLITRIMSRFADRVAGQRRAATACADAQASYLAAERAEQAFKQQIEAHRTRAAEHGMTFGLMPDSEERFEAVQDARDAALERMIREPAATAEQALAKLVLWVEAEVPLLDQRENLMADVRRFVAFDGPQLTTAPSSTDARAA